MFCILWCALIVCVSTKQQSCKLQTCFIRLKKDWSRSRGKQTLCLALFKIYSIYRLEKTPVKHLIFYVFFIFFSAARLKFSIFYLLQDDYRRKQNPKPQKTQNNNNTSNSQQQQQQAPTKFTKTRNAVINYSNMLHVLLILPAKKTLKQQKTTAPDSRYILQAANAGVARAMCSAAFCYQRGLGCAVSASSAVHWYRRLGTVRHGVWVWKGWVMFFQFFFSRICLWCL